MDIRRREYPREVESISFRFPRMIVSFPKDLWIFSIRRANSPREINGIERAAGYAFERPHSHKSLNISNYFSLFGYLRGGSAAYEDPGGRSKIFQNLYITCDLKILIIHRI